MAHELLPQLCMLTDPPDPVCTHAVQTEVLEGPSAPPVPPESITWSDTLLCLAEPSWDLQPQRRTPSLLNDRVLAVSPRQTAVKEPLFAASPQSSSVVALREKQSCM